MFKAVNRLLAIVQRHTEPLKRCGAMLLVAVVLLLGVLQVLPVAHECLHADAGSAEHECAVTLFAHGVDPVVANLVLAVVIWRLLARALESREVFVQAPAFVHLPGRAPPSA